jgi:3-dehydroquinate synthase
MLPLPAALGAIRLTNVEDEVLERHAQAYLASRKELL